MGRVSFRPRRTAHVTSPRPTSHLPPPPSVCHVQHSCRSETVPSPPWRRRCNRRVSGHRTFSPTRPPRNGDAHAPRTGTACGIRPSVRGKVTVGTPAPLALHNVCLDSFRAFCGCRASLDGTGVWCFLRPPVLVLCSTLCSTPRSSLGEDWGECACEDVVAQSRDPFADVQRRRTSKVCGGC